MKEYKVIETKKNQAETIMNEMAAQGWEVVSMTYWNAWKISLLITLTYQCHQGQAVYWYVQVQDITCTARKKRAEFFLRKKL